VGARGKEAMTLYGEREGAVRPMPTVPVAGKKAGSRFKVQGTRFRAKGTKLKAKGNRSQERAKPVADSRLPVTRSRGRDLFRVIHWGCRGTGNGEQVTWISPRAR